MQDDKNRRSEWRVMGGHEGGDGGYMEILHIPLVSP